MTRKETVARLLDAIFTKQLNLDSSDIRVVVDGEWVGLVWENGPYEWAYALLGGESIFAEEAPELGHTPEAWQSLVQEVVDKYEVSLEAINSFTISVWEA